VSRSLALELEVEAGSGWVQACALEAHRARALTSGSAYGRWVSWAWVVGSWDLVVHACEVANTWQSGGAPSPGPGPRPIRRSATTPHRPHVHRSTVHGPQHRLMLFPCQQLPPTVCNHPAKQWRRKIMKGKIA